MGNLNNSKDVNSQAPTADAPDVVLYTMGLLSKWGFQDGDIISNWLWDNRNEEWAKTNPHKLLDELVNPHKLLDELVNPHKLLDELVKRYLLPKLNHKVETCYIETIHNPVRADMIDGQPYTNWYEDDNWKKKLTPEFVSIPGKDVLKLAKEMDKS